MKISKLTLFVVFVLSLSIGLLACGGEKSKVVKYLNKINDFVNSEEYKKAGLGFVEQSTTSNPAGEKTFDENKLNELVSALIETKDLEICKSVGFKDRDEASSLVNKYLKEQDPVVKDLTEKIDKSMTSVAIELQKEGMAKMNITMPPNHLEDMNKMHENLKPDDKTKTDAKEKTDKKP